MPSSADDCSKLVAVCERGAEESRDEETRLAFRQMAKALAQLALGANCTEPHDEPLDVNVIDGGENTEDESRPFGIPSETDESIAPVPKMGNGDWRDRTSRLQQLSLQPRTPFPKR